MTLQDLVNLGEFIGEIAVEITLVYLAIQLRHNTDSVRASAETAPQIAFQNTYFMMALSREAVDAVNRSVREDVQGLSLDFQQFSWWLKSLLLVLQTQFD